MAGRSTRTRRLPRRHVAGALLVLGLALTAAAAAPQRRAPIQWRLEGGAAALEPTAHVRLEVENAIPSTSLHPAYGLVQVVVYLFGANSPAAPRLEQASDAAGLAVVSEPHGSGDDLRVTVEVVDLAPEDAALALVVGRSVKVHGVQEASPEDRRRPGALRADGADLEDRRRWATDTLLPAGEERLLWEGTVPLETDGLYADFLAVRGRGNPPARTATSDAGGSRPPGQDPGIFDLSPTTVSNPPPLPAGTTGVTVVRPAGRRRFPLELERGRLNVIRVRAIEDATGALGLEVQHDLEEMPVPSR